MIITLLFMMVKKEISNENLLKKMNQMDKDLKKENLKISDNKNVNRSLFMNEKKVQVSDAKDDKLTVSHWMTFLIYKSNINTHKVHTYSLIYLSIATILVSISMIINIYFNDTTIFGYEISYIIGMITFIVLIGMIYIKSILTDSKNADIAKLSDYLLDQIINDPKFRNVNAIEEKWGKEIKFIDVIHSLFPKKEDLSEYYNSSIYGKKNEKIGKKTSKSFDKIKLLIKNKIQ